MPRSICKRCKRDATQSASQVFFTSAPIADEETLGLALLLVQHYRENWRHCEALMERTNGQPALSIIITPETIDQLASRLVPWCVVDADGYTVALSFADTRILPAVVEALTAQQRGQFLGPARRWIYTGRD